jgi:predicted Zn-dependent protease
MRGLIRGVVLVLVVGLLFAPSFCGQTKAQPEHTIETRGQTWPYSLIRVCIVTQENQAWWKTEYIDSALNGVAMWNDAIQEFSLNFTEFGHLSKVSLVPTVSTEPVTGFDVYIGWVDECELEETIGQTKLLVNGSCSIVNSTVCLAAKAPSGHVMTEVDMQNIVVHELGHNFGLSHCSNSEDVMYMVVQYRNTVKALSSLDLYAVAQRFEWLNNTEMNKSSSCTELTTLSLPSNIPYSYLSIANENIPISRRQSITEQLIELFFSPESLFLIITAVVLILIVAVIVTKYRKQKSLT